LLRDIEVFVEPAWAFRLDLEQIAQRRRDIAVVRHRERQFGCASGSAKMVTL